MHKNDFIRATETGYINSTWLIYYATPKALSRRKSSSLTRAPLYRRKVLSQNVKCEKILCLKSRRNILNVLNVNVLNNTFNKFYKDVNLEMI